jgi:hypothetical protein
MILIALATQHDETLRPGGAAFLDALRVVGFLTLLWAVIYLFFRPHWKKNRELMDGLLGWAVIFLSLAFTLVVFSDITQGGEGVGYAALGLVCTLIGTVWLVVSSRRSSPSGVGS